MATPPKRKETLITGREEKMRMSSMAVEETNFPIIIDFGLSRLAKSKSKVPLSFSNTIEVEVKAGVKRTTRMSCPNDRTVNRSRDAKAPKE